LGISIPQSNSNYFGIGSLNKECVNFVEGLGDLSDKQARFIFFVAASESNGSVFDWWGSEKR